MTFQQFLSILRARRLLILAAVIVTIGSGAAYVTVRSHTYQSESVVQLAGVTSTTTPATIPLSVTAPATITAAAAELHISTAEANAEARNVVTTYDANSNQITISAIAKTPTEAQTEANAFANGYVAAEVAQNRTALKALKSAAQVLAGKVSTLTQGPQNALTAAALSAATQSYATVETEINTAETAVAPAAIASLASPGAPTGESKSRVLGIAALIGLLAGCGLALVRDHLDNRLGEGSEDDAALGFPVLARLPFEPTSDPRNFPLPVVDDASSLFAERIRELRTRMQATMGGRESSVLLLTSTDPGDGKSFITANLAASWALAGRQTVVVSTDLRRPRLDALLGFPETHQGISTLMKLSEVSQATIDEKWQGKRDNADAEWSPAAFRRRRTRSSEISLSAVLETLVKTRLEGLMLLPAGPHVDIDPADLLARSSMREIIDRLREAFDYVIIDTPAASAVPDASTLASLADGVILVARSKKTDTTLLHKTAERLQTAGAQILGIVINLTDESAGAAHAYYHVADINRARTVEPTPKPIIREISQ